jgi:hypothetical protein
MKIKEDSTMCRPPPSAPSEEEIMFAVPILVAGDGEHQHYQNEQTNAAAVATVVTTTTETVNHHFVVGDNDDDADRAHHAEAAAARAQGTDLIRHHLNHHLEQNPHSTYVTWIATLHPENAVVAIDPRFLIPNNPWLTVYEDAVQHHRSNSSNDDGTPTSAVIIDSPHDDDKGNVCGRRGLLDLIVGWSLTIAAVLVTFSLELVAMYLLFSIWLCFKTTSKDRGGCFGPPLNILKLIPFCICHLILAIFILLNAVVFVLSILAVEMIAAISFLICTLFSLSCKVGLDHHQRTRRIAHLIRWAFRHRFEDLLDPCVRGSPTLECCTGDESAALTKHPHQPATRCNV